MGQLTKLAKEGRRHPLVHVQGKVKECEGGTDRVVGGVAIGYTNTPRPSHELKRCTLNLLVAPSGSRTFPGAPS